LQTQFSRDGEKIGEYAEELVPTLLKLGAILSTDFYWHEGMDAWESVAIRWPDASSAKTKASPVARGLSNQHGDQSALPTDVAAGNKSARSGFPDTIAAACPINTRPSPMQIGPIALPQEETKLYRGSYGLPKTFWLHLGLASLAGTVWKIWMGYESYRYPVKWGVPTPPLDALGVMCAFVIYQLLATIGTWNAASRYDGPKVWRVLAKIVAVIAALLIGIQLLQIVSYLGLNVL